VHIPSQLLFCDCGIQITNENRGVGGIIGIAGRWAEWLPFILRRKRRRRKGFPSVQIRGYMDWCTCGGGTLTTVLIAEFMFIEELIPGLMLIPTFMPELMLMPGLITIPIPMPIPGPIPTALIDDVVVFFCVA